ncbi:MAG: flagellar basal-body MS-ring/collar protein FliF [Gammaproteobacteria bacterium]|nr:flagellar basal-body MS-ring/collar protein FliF [Gammaproteobacteria bacterium]
MAEAAVPVSSSMPFSKLLSFIVGLAVSIAIGVGVFYWAAAPSYDALYNGLEPRDASEVVAALQGAAISYKLDGATGTVLVESGRVHEARLKLAAQGLPKGTSIGIEMLSEEQSFGTSQFVESARYHHAMETELARTISTMRNVKSARVHLAIPKKSVFVRKQETSSASVAINLYGGRTIDQGQVNAIVHLVASSVSNLSPSNITVVDQTGRLLSSGDLSSNVALTAKQYDYTRQVEMDYARRIEHLLEPIIGVGKVRATVNAEIDFTQEESTEEIFNPERTAVRSEQSSETATFDQAQGAGVPGALANQPPEGGVLVEGAGALDAPGAAGTPLNSSKKAVRNYELDRTIRHKRQSVGLIKRLTVAVLVDDHVKGTGGNAERTPLTDEEIARINTLVQQTIGFDQQRGDLVNVINASFTPVEAAEALPEPSLLDNPLLKNITKQVLAGIIILILLFKVVIPTFRNLSEYTPPAPVLPSPEGGGEAGGEGEMARLEHKQGLALPSDHDEKVEFAKAMVGQDPGKVANVVKGWIGNES